MPVSDEEVARQLMSLAHVTRKWLKSRLAGELFDNHLFSEARFRILKIINENKCMKMSALSNSCHVSKGSLTITLGKLVEEGYVERVYHKDDRRVVMVRLTESGEEYLKQMLTTIITAVSKQFENINLIEKEKLYFVMKELTKIFE